jgi:hypothetical protein
MLRAPQSRRPPDPNNETKRLYAFNGGEYERIFRHYFTDS